MIAAGRRFRGSITIFLCLMLVTVMGFTGACLEYARGQAVQARLQMAADCAAESIFAGYYDPLLASYRLFGRLIPRGNMEELEKETLRYVSGCGSGITGFSAESALWNEVTRMTDQNGRVFTHMAAEAMEAEGVSWILSQWRDRLGLGDAGGQAMEANAGKDSWNVKEVLEGYDDWNKTLQRAEKAAAEEAQRQQEAAAAEGAAAPPPAGPDEGGTRVLNLIETMKSILGNGPMALVLPRGARISSGTLEGSLPSGLSSGEKGRTVGKRVSGGSRLLLQEYLMRHMDCFTTDADKSVAYEMEYLAVGKKTDRENLESAVTRILWMRIALNTAYLNTDAGKIAEARQAALAAVGWTGIVPLVEVTTRLLLTAWASGEAILDVRTLMAGEKVPLKKDAATWKLSLNRLADVRNNTMAGISDNSDQGLSYVDHLRIVLLTVSEEKLAYRGMDVIQWNLRKLDPDFRMNRCMVSGDITVTAVIRPVFSVLYRGIGSMGSVPDGRLQKKGHSSYI